MASSSQFKPEKVCRTCLSESSNMKSLFSKIGDEEKTLFEVLCCIINTNILIGNEFPEQICSDCEQILCKIEDFKRRCADSEAAIEQYIKGNICTIIPENEKTEHRKVKNKRVKVEKEDLADEEFIPFLCSNCYTTHSTLGALQIHKKTCTVKQKRKKVKMSPDSSSAIVRKDLDEVFKSTSINLKVENFNEIDYNDHFDDTSLPNLEELPIEFKPLNNISPCGFKTEGDTENCQNEYKLFKKTKLLALETQSEEFLKMITENTEMTVKRFNRERKKRPPVPDKDKFQCSMCMRKFIQKSSLAAHIKKHEEEALIKHVCPTCKREFNYKAHLDNHIINVHTAEKGFGCDFCGKTFTNQSSLKTHKELHKSLKKHDCKECGKAFFMLSTLVDHMRTHTGEKPFLCSICGKGFSQKNNMVQHVRRHQGLKPFKCDLCERSFVSKGELTAHKRKHSGAHPFICNDCGNGFTTSSSLVKHRRIHTGEKPYACDLCPMKFAASGTLTNHRRTHTNERPYLCSHCDKSFIQRTDLISHIRCHTGEKPYVCTSCGQSFRKSAGLKMHVRNCHGKEPSLNPGVYSAAVLQRAYGDQQ